MVTGVFQTSPSLSLCEAAQLPLFPSEELFLLSTLTHLPTYNSTFKTTLSHSSLRTTEQILPKLKQSPNIPLSINSLQPIQPHHPSWTWPQPCIRLDLTQIPLPNKSDYIPQIQQLLREYPNTTLCLTDGSKSKTQNSICLLHQCLNYASPRGHPLCAK